MQEAHAFARHRIFVSAGEIERSRRNPGKVCRYRHEAVIAVDDDQCIRTCYRIDDRCEIAERKS